jgi:hypothetical protein
MRRLTRGAFAAGCLALALAAGGCEGDCSWHCGDSAYSGYSHCEGGAELALVYGVLIGIWFIGRVIEGIAHGCR